MVTDIHFLRCIVYDFIDKEEIMQSIPVPQRRIGPAVFGQGTLFAVIFGLVLLIVALLELFVTGSSPIGWLVVCAWFLTTILAGYRVSRSTRSVGAGTLAGLWTGFLNAFITDIYILVIYLITFSQSNAEIDKAIQQAQEQMEQSGVTYTITRDTILLGLVISGVILLVVSLAFGSAVGAIAGLVGKNAAGPAPQQPYPPYPSTPQR
jgi:hypothetical protein